MCEVWGKCVERTKFYPDILVPPSHAVIQVRTLTSFARLGIHHSDILTVLTLNNPRHNDRKNVYKNPSDHTLATYFYQSITTATRTDFQLHSIMPKFELNQNIS
jgi:hypothetical protein